MTGANPANPAVGAEWFRSDSGKLYLYSGVPTQVETDNFTGASGAALSSSWTALSVLSSALLKQNGSGYVYSNTPGTTTAAYWNVNTSVLASLVQAKIYVGSAAGTVILYNRLATSTAYCYFCQYTATGIQLVVYSAGGLVQLGSLYSHTAVTGDVIGLKCDSTTISVFLNGAVIISVVDSTISPIGSNIYAAIGTTSSSSQIMPGTFLFENVGNYNVGMSEV